MIDKVLCPLDGSSLSDAILEQASWTLLRSGAETTLFHVLPPPHNFVREDWEREARTAGNRLANLTRTLESQGIRVHVEVRTGEDVAGEITAYAESYPPALIAMSTHGAGGLRRWVRGSTCERVLSNTRFPVLTLTPPGLVTGGPPCPVRFRRILVPVDGSRRCMEVLTIVSDFARLHDSTVVLFHVGPALRAPGVLRPPIPATDGPPPFLEPWRISLAEQNIELRVATATGDPAEEILRASDRGDCDLVAMTTHGSSGMTRWLYGSVADKVMRNVRRPLLLLPNAV